MVYIAENDINNITFLHLMSSIYRIQILNDIHLDGDMQIETKLPKHVRIDR